MIDPRASDQEIAGHAIFSAGRVRTVLGAIGRTGHGATSPEQLTSQLNAIATACRARPCDKKTTLQGRIARMSDSAWWRRSVRRELVRENEAIEHAAGHVRRRNQVYVTDHAIHAAHQRDKANAQTLENLEVCNEYGEAFSLSDVAAGSVSNPKLRRAELMMRCRGFEETAAYMHHEAHFLTITTPSRFHRFNAAGKDNPKWDGSTPRDAQAYLCKVWAKIRAEWKRRGFMPYGFRVCEPHHDGCPHWHILLFMPPETAGWFEARRLVADRDDYGAGVLGIVGRYALEDSAGEPGALKHRFTAEKIDLDKGSATGYIAKYICKNIDGLKEDGDGMGLDFASGKNASEASERVRVWARTWGIRQFQQIGGPSVTVWRELRRLGKEIEQPLQLPLFEMPRAAADRALWALFWVLQGGPETPRSQLSLKPFYVTDGAGVYGDEMRRIKGVHGHDETGEYMEVTRLHEWTIQRAGLAEVNRQQAEHFDYMDRQKAIAKFLSAAGIRDLDEFHAREAGAWTGVNNCTAPTSPALNFEAVAGLEPRPKPGAPTWNGARSLVWRQGTPEEVAPELLIAEKNERFTNSLRH